MDSGPGGHADDAQARHGMDMRESDVTKLLE